MRLVPPRSFDPELMDRPDNSRAALDLALRDLRHVNRLLGGQRTLLRALRPHLASIAAGAAVEILDVGTGAADLPVAMADQLQRLGHDARIVAVDREPHIVALAARHAAGYEQVRVVRADAFALPFAPRSFDIVTASLFLHHFDPENVVRLLASFASLARRAVVVNDLRRHLFAWWLTHLVGRVTRRNPMFLHDGPLSVLRGFTDDELAVAARLAGVRRYSVMRCWPFRLALTLEPAP